MVDVAGAARRVEELMKLPQALCRKSGDCCRVATFKGSLNLEDIHRLARSEDSGADAARDFLTLFEPYESQEAAAAVASEFVRRVRERAERPDEVRFFRCRFLGANNTCQVWEDRPVGCRMYPFPHEKTLYHPGCGFEQQGMANWQEIAKILASLEAYAASLEEAP